MSNVREKKTGQLLANGHEWLIIPWAGKKVRDALTCSLAETDADH